MHFTRKVFTLIKDSDFSDKGNKCYFYGYKNLNFMRCFILLFYRSVTSEFFSSGCTDRCYNPS